MLPSWMGVAGFVDIHCHLIAGIDDGPKSDQQTFALLDPHAQRASPPSSRRRIAARAIASTQPTATPRLAAAEAVAHDTPLLFAGCELELTEERLRQFFKDPRRYTLNGSRYVLVELPHSAGGGGLDRAAKLFRERGLRPVLAHPERYPFLSADSPALAAWIAHGGLLQATAASFTGRMGRRAKAAAYDLLSRNALHFVASDAHDAVKRGPDMREAFANVAAARDIAVAGRLFTHNPLAAVRDELLR